MVKSNRSKLVIPLTKANRFILVKFLDKIRASQIIKSEQCSFKQDLINTLLLTNIKYILLLQRNYAGVIEIIVKAINEKTQDDILSNAYYSDLVGDSYQQALQNLFKISKLK